MVKVAGNLRAAVLSARVLLVCSLFAIGLAPSAGADFYQYTVTFDPLNATCAVRDCLYTKFSFDTTSLLGNASVSINPSEVQVIAAPHEGFDVTNFITNLNVSSSSFSVVWLSKIGPVSDGCFGELTNFNCFNSAGNGTFLNPITSPGTYQFDGIDMTDYKIGAGQQLEYYPAKDPLLEGSVR